MTDTAFNTASPLRRVTLHAALVAAFIATVTIAPADAGERPDDNSLPQVAVSYIDLDLETDAGAAALYRRLTTAARRVCPDGGSRSLQHAQAVRECRADTLARAISNVGSAKLAALQASRKRAG